MTAQEKIKKSESITKESQPSMTAEKKKIAPIQV
jgi:hypothetical protein